MTLGKMRRVTVTEACHKMGVPRSTFYYEAKPRAPAPPDPEVEAAIVEIAAERPSFGYRRMTAMVNRRLDRRVNHKKVHRIMREKNILLHPWFQPRKRVPKRPGRLITERPDTAYQMDLKYVWCGRDGWGYLQSAVETCTNEWLGYIFSKRCGSREAKQVLDAAVHKRFPECRVPGTRLRVDNGPGYRADAFIEHATSYGFDVEHIQVRTPEQNGCIESLHAGLDRDYLNHLAFDSFAEAEAYIAWAYQDYNHEKPQQRLGWRTPAEYRATFPFSPEASPEVTANVN